MTSSAVGVPHQALVALLPQPPDLAGDLGVRPLNAPASPSRPAARRVRRRCRACYTGRHAGTRLAAKMRRGGRSLEAATDVIITIRLAVAAANPPLPWLAGAKRLIAGYLRVIRCVGPAAFRTAYSALLARGCADACSSQRPGREESDVTPLGECAVSA